MTKKQKSMLISIVVSVVLFIAVMILTHTVTELPWYVELVIFAGIYLICGLSPLRKAVINISHGQVFDENFLMCLATVCAFIVGEYHEAVEVMVFYRIGELFESIAVGRSRRAVTELMDICPDDATVIRDGARITVDADEVEVGEHIVVSAGERIPMDGVVVSGNGSVDASALTGEAVPLSVNPGADVLSGCINMTGTLEIQVTKISEESTAAKILELVEEAVENKARTESFITKFARYYTPAVVIGAVVLALVPPLFTGFNFVEWIMRALTFLIVSCPCALVISVPLSFFSGIGSASKNGILIKGSSYIEVLSKAKTVVMDKTGTLTKGTFTVTEIKPIEPIDMSSDELLEYAAYAESDSNHPIGRSIRDAYGREIDYSLIKNQSETAGRGVYAEVKGIPVYAGTENFLRENGVDIAAVPADGTIVNISADGKYAGFIKISDTVKEDAAEALAGLRSAGVSKLVMLTGDSRASAATVAQTLLLDQVEAELFPADKVRRMEQLRRELDGRGSLIFMGDGMNDAPVLAQSDAGVAMGAFGSDAAIEAADIVIMDDKPSKLVLAVRIAKKTMAVARQNIVFALGVKAVVLVLGAFGIAGMELAVFADVGVSAIAILNAMRAGKV